MGFFHLEWRSHESGKKNVPLSHEWLSRRGKKIFPHEQQSREWGNFIFTATVETTSKTSCSYHLHLQALPPPYTIDLEESKGSFTSVSDTLLTLWAFKAHHPIDGGHIT